MANLIIPRDQNNIPLPDVTPSNQKITTSGSIVYIGIALPGVAQATAGWQCKKVDSTDPNNVIITWAGAGKFNQVATDLTALTYA